MALLTASPGAITVADTTVDPSGMSAASVTGIGHGATAGTGNAQRSLTAAAITTGPIGQPQTAQTLKAVSTPALAVGANKAIRYLLVATDTAPDGVIDTGWVNRSGRTLRAGEYAYGVAA